MDARFCGSDLWDSDLSWVSVNPTLTVCFKNTILIWIPCGFLWIFSIPDIYWIRKSRHASIPWSIVNVTKLICVILLILLSTIDLIFMILHRMYIDAVDERIYDVQFVSIGIKIVTFFYAAFIQQFHKRKGNRASILLFLFWLILTICAIPQIISEANNFNVDFGDNERLWSSYHSISYIIFFTLSSAMTALSAFSDKTSLNSTHKSSEKSSPELKAGALNLLFFQWFSSLTWIGFKRPLTEDDVYDVNPEYETSELITDFDKYFQKSIRNNQRKPTDTSSSQSNQTTNGSIIYALIHAFGGRYLFAIFLRFIADFLQFGSPFLLSTLIDYIGTGGALWKGLLLAFAFFTISAVSAIINNIQYMMAFQIGFKARSSLISAVYRKALKISSAAKKNITIGEIVNLMAVDAHRFYEMMPYLPFVVTMPFLMGLTMYFLWVVIGPSAFAGLGVLVLMFPFSGVIAAKLQTYQADQMQFKDDRVKKITEILGGIKVIKFYAWEKSFQDQIRDTRESELRHLRGAALMTASTDFLWTLTPFLITFATFTTYVMIGNVLQPDVAFVSIVLFNILRLPITLLPMSINFIMMGIVSTRRLNSFLNSKELDPNNVSNNPSQFALDIRNGDFSWDGKEKTLRNIQLSVEKGKLAAVVGQVGSGKSSLISALLGDMERLNGQVNVDGTIAYVPQIAWIQNATLKENILFGKPLNENLYEKVIQACALSTDLAILPAGDKTEIGEKGINLSGGQKARVSLARAVYNCADIYIFDDPLSAVDSHVGKHIFENVFGEDGLLKDKTRLLVTHAISYLPKVDEIFVMTDGEIKERGSYKQLLAQKGQFADFLIEYLQEHQDDEEIENIKTQLDGTEVDYIVKRTISISSDGKSKRKGSRLSAHVNLDSKGIEDKLKAPEAADKLIETEEAAIGNVSFSVYLRYFKSVGGKFVFVIILFAMSSEASSALANLLIVQWAEDERTGSETFWRNLYVIIYGAFGLLLAISFLTAAITFAFGAIRAARNLHNRLLKNILRVPMAFFDTTPLGRIVNRFSRDTDMIDSYIPAMMFSWCTMLFSVAGTLILISYATPLFAAVAVPLVIFYYMIQKFYIKTSRQLKRIESITRSPIYSHFGESVSGQSVIRAYKEVERFKKESERKVDRNLSVLYLSNIADCWLGVRLENIGAFIVLFACLFAILARDDIQQAIVGLSISYAIQISAVLSYFVMIATEVETNIVAVERVEEYADLPQEAPLKTIDVYPEWPQHGIIEFRNFQVRYRDGLDLVLKGISFKCHSQEKIGVVGRTGAGKSSLTLSLFRIIEGAGGEILIDGLDISTMGLHTLRTKLTIIPQDPVLFSGSLRMNIDPFNSYTDDAIWTALEHSHLKSFVLQLPDSLGFKVAEGGDNLSVGQRQLICLARALLRKTSVLILDEATAAIDFETDELIQKTIRKEFNHCTILTIAHRLNTIMDSDRIIVLEQGKIAEFDSPGVLMKNKESIFYGMAKSAGIDMEE